MIFNKKNLEDNGVNKAYVEETLDSLNHIYSNKSSDEYKCKGDITASPVYDHIELQLANLNSIKKLAEADIKSLKDLFNVLHRPIFKKMVTEYLAEPNERNIVFTAVFTVGYRLLIGELSRIYTSSEATDTGFVYKPDKISKNQSNLALIRKYNSDIEKKLDDAIKRAAKNATPVQEAATLAALGAAAEGIVTVIEGVFGFLNGIFRSAAAMNPIALISACLSRSYDKKVEKYEKIAAEYEAAKKAYDEYKKIPENKRKERVDHNYTKMIEKYNIKMQNLKAQIDHYDQRAMEEAKDVVSNKPSSSSSEKKNDDNGPDSSSTVDTSSNDNDMDF